MTKQFIKGYPIVNVTITSNCKFSVFIQEDYGGRAYCVTLSQKSMQNDDFIRNNRALIDAKCSEALNKLFAEVRQLNLSIPLPKRVVKNNNHEVSR